MSNNKYIGQRIKSLRRYHALTQKELAHSIGKTESTIQKYEAGKVEIPWSVIENIATVLGTTAFHLVSYSMDEIGKLTEEESENRFMSILYMLGYDIVKLEDGTFEIAGKTGSVIATKTEMDNLYKTFLDYISYTTDKFYKEKKEERFI